MRDRFPHATVDFIERIGAANWHRLGLKGPDDVMEITVDTAASKFQDSGLGSSLGSELSSNHILDIPQDTRSVVSIRSFMETEQGATTLQSMPPEDSEGNRICYICQKTLKDVHHESQWKRHVFSDLRPYVCIVEDCRANSVQFASRSEFAAHLTEHQLYKTWRCMKCNTSSQSFDFIQDHVAHSHPLSTPAQQGCQIEELSHLRDLSTQRCPFCNDIPGHANFVGHICHHLEETSLSAIPREEGEFDEDAREGMSWEGNSPGDADKSGIERAAVEEILEKPKPEPTTGLDKDEETWGFWGASTSKKDKKKRKDKKKPSSLLTGSGGNTNCGGGTVPPPPEAQPVGLEEGLAQVSLSPDEPGLEAAEATSGSITTSGYTTTGYSQAPYSPSYIGGQGSSYYLNSSEQSQNAQPSESPTDHPVSQRYFEY
ncbi:hypothetical protein VE00_09683 [Pseudogymnoascus sp. WSF 3629]|nr:hypothetical protein VE00_09683 [Pseudogymnoascus sp. WSF 3629]